jgi:hypothetical protein
MLKKCATSVIIFSSKINHHFSGILNPQKRFCCGVAWVGVLKYVLHPVFALEFIPSGSSSKCGIIGSIQLARRESLEVAAIEFV